MSTKFTGKKDQRNVYTVIFTPFVFLLKPAYDKSF